VRCFSLRGLLDIAGNKIALLDRKLPLGYLDIPQYMGRSFSDPATLDISEFFTTSRDRGLR
jgi:hypothetical protein